MAYKVQGREESKWDSVELYISRIANQPQFSFSTSPDIDKEKPSNQIFLTTVCRRPVNRQERYIYDWNLKSMLLNSFFWKKGLLSGCEEAGEG
jgi:hypothetical protein